MPSPRSCGVVIWKVQVRTVPPSVIFVMWVVLECVERERESMLFRHLSKICGDNWLLEWKSKWSTPIVRQVPTRTRRRSSGSPISFASRAIWLFFATKAVTMIHRWISGATYVIKMSTVLAGVVNMEWNWLHREVRWTSCFFHERCSPLGIEHRQTDWKTFLVNKLVGAKTLPDNFRQKVNALEKNSILLISSLD